MTKPDVEIDDGSGRIIISSEEGETEGNLILIEIITPKIFNNFPRIK